MSEKETTPHTAGPGSGDAPAPLGSIILLSDDDVEKVAGGVVVSMSQDTGPHFAHTDHLSARREQLSATDFVLHG